MKMTKKYLILVTVLNLITSTILIISTLGENYKTVLIVLIILLTFEWIIDDILKYRKTRINK